MSDGRDDQRVAVVVPTHDRAHLVPRIVAALAAQDAAFAFDVVVVDDCSADDTAQALAAQAAQWEGPIRILRNDRVQGPAHARNRGWRATDADVLAFVDDDCTPSPGWLAAGVAALTADEGLGVVQGRTIAPPPDVHRTDWTLCREVEGPTPWFEGCNIFYRRTALEATGGFDEAIAWYGEDTALGWAVLSAGWRRGFAADALVVHDAADRGIGWFVRQAFNEGHLIDLAVRFPRFREAAFWRPWAFRRSDAAFALAVVGLACTPRWRWSAIAASPWLHLRRPPRHHERALALLAERAAVDAGMLVGRLAAARRTRRLIL